MRSKIANFCASHLLTHILKHFIRVKFAKWASFTRASSAKLDKQMLDEAWSKAHKLAISVRKTRNRASILVSVKYLK